MSSSSLEQSTLPLTGKLALITGSSRGIGYELALGFVRAGASVVINSRSEADLGLPHSQLTEEIARLGSGASVHGFAFDVTDETAVHDAIHAIEDSVGPIEILVNNAGIQLRGPLVDLPLSSWKQVLDVNLTGAFVVGREIGRQMIPRQRGKILNICSVQSSIVRPTTAPYAASKAGISNLTKAMCAEWAGFGIQINGLAPGYIITELNTALVNDPEFNSWITKRTPAGRWGTPADIVGPALWLCSDAADFVNGQTIYADGGLTAVI